MRVSYSTLVKAKRAGRATSVRVQPTGTAVTDYQVSLGKRHSLKDAGVVGMPSWSEKSTQTETWVRVPRLSATCPRRVVAFDGGRGNIDRCMEFGDEFDGTAINAAKWTTTGTVTVSGSVATITGGAGLFSTLQSAGTLESVVVEGRIKSEHSGGFNANILEEFSLVSTVTWRGHRAWFVQNSNVAYASPAYANYTTGYTFGTMSGWSAGAFHRITVKRTGSAAVWSVDGGTPVSVSGNYETSTLPITLNAYGAGYQMYADWIFVRKYVASEPLTGTAQPSATNRAMSRPMRKADLIRACCT